VPSTGQGLAIVAPATNSWNPFLSTYCLVLVLLQLALSLPES
jgi:hypothetical protein